MSLKKKRTKGLEYNCEHCKQYWEVLKDYWKDLPIEYIKLYCPRCKRVEGRDW